jgi:hypothetical protein
MHVPRQVTLKRMDYTDRTQPALVPTSYEYARSDGNGDGGGTSTVDDSAIVACCIICIRLRY